MDDATPHEQPVEPMTPQARNLAAKSALVQTVREELPAEAELEPTIDLASRQIKRRAIDVLMAKAMSGQLPRYRSLKSWEPDKLDERHIQAVLMRAGGMSQNKIAEYLGWEPAWTSVILNHPDAQYLLTRIVSYAADNVIDLQERIKATAPEAFDTVLEVMRSTNDQDLRSKNAFEILKMAGYGAQKSPAVVINSQVNQGVSAKAIGQLTQAIREAAMIQEVQYEVLPSTGPESEGSVSPDLLEGSQGVAEPPGGGSPAQEEEAA